MTQNFSRVHRGVILTLVAALALCSGYLLSSLMELALQPESTRSTPPVTHIKHELSQRSAGNINLIVSKNLFDPASRGRQATEPERDKESSDVKPAPLRKDLLLLGTMVAGPDSTTLLKVGRDTSVYRLGEEIPGGGKIEEIARNRITLRTPDQSAIVLSVDSPTGATAQAAPPAIDEDDNGIQSVSDRQWKISRTAAESARANLGEQLRLAQIEPRLVNGRTDGFTVMLLNPRSLLSKMGIKRGDTILQVNEMLLDSPEKALQILQQLREARRIEVGIERDHESMTFTYELE